MPILSSVFALSNNYILPFNEENVPFSKIAPLQCLLDSGATNSILSERLYNTLNQEWRFPLNPSDHSLSLADDGQMKVKGEMHANVMLKDNFYN